MWGHARNLTTAARGRHRRDAAAAGQAGQNAECAAARERIIGVARVGDPPLYAAAPDVDRPLLTPGQQARSAGGRP